MCCVRGEDLENDDRRLVDQRIDAAHPPKVRIARAAVWAAGAAPAAGQPCMRHRRHAGHGPDKKQDAAAKWKEYFGPSLVLEQALAWLRLAPRP